MEDALIKLFRDLGCDYFYEYDQAYGFIKFDGKTVVHVGADCGSSIIYFLLRGAKRVIAYEKNQDLCKKYFDNFHKYIKDRVEYKCKQWEGELDFGDIFIIDCDGCEDLITDDLLMRIDASYETKWIAVHDWASKRDWLTKRLLELGYTKVYETPDHWEKAYFKTTSR